MRSSHEFRWVGGLAFLGLMLENAPLLAQEGPPKGAPEGACCTRLGCMQAGPFECLACPGEPMACAGDVASSPPITRYRVDNIDVTAVKSCMGTSPQCCRYDLTCDGIVDEADVQYVEDRLGTMWPYCDPPEYCPGSFAGYGTSCTPGLCGACCISLMDYDCRQTTAAHCAAIDGAFNPDASVCLAEYEQVILAEVVEPSGEVFVHTVSKVVGCASGGKRADCQPGTPVDAWASPANANMVLRFGGSGYPPVPADFFGPGSDPFANTCGLEGVPLGPTPYGDFGQADTLILRSGGDPFDRCVLPSPAEQAVDIEIAALSLKGVQPITVTYGGQAPEPWDVTVDLSAVHTDADPANDPPVGYVRAKKTHCNGGLYTSVLNVQPRFTFTKVSDPDTVRVLDSGLLLPPWPYTSLNQEAQDIWVDWVHDPDPGIEVVNPICTTFHVGIKESNGVTACDCNGNGVRDRCDIETAVSRDCQPNTIPDECELAGGSAPDCNGNGTPDECDIAAGSSRDCNDDGTPDECGVGGSADCNANLTPDECDVAAGTSPDCNTNGIPDECDVAFGTSWDCNANGTPDECEADCNSNGIGDACDLAWGWSFDCNGNGAPDECDIAGSTSLDCDTNGIPDECETHVSITGLGTLGGDGSSTANAMNVLGQVVGQSWTATWEHRAFLWLPDPAYGLPAGMTDLGTLGGYDSDARAINDLGQVAGTAGMTEGYYRAFLWLPQPAYGLPAGMNDLGTLGGWGYSRAEAINDSAQVVGWATTATGEDHAFLWLPQPDYGYPAGMIDLGTLGGWYSEARAMNTSGQVVGCAYTATGQQHAFLWLPEPAYGLPPGMTDLGTLGGWYSEARAMNTSGQVVGCAYTATGQQHAFLWLPEPAYGLPAGLNDLGTLGGTWSTAYTINDRGQIIGDSSTASEWSHGFFWENGVMTDLGTLGGYDSYTSGLNTLGQVVGWSYTAMGAQDAFLWLPAPAYGLPAGMTDLSDILPPESGWELWSAVLINDAGQVAGNGLNAGLGDVFFMTVGNPDCNRNCIPDACDLDCGSPGGACDVPGCGLADDCNGNRVPDECDFTGGTAEDCNTNGILDECDLILTLPSIIDMGALGGEGGWASAMNAGHQVVGAFYTASGWYHAFLWLPEPAYGLPAGMTDLGTFGGNYSDAHAINDLGQVAGMATTVEGWEHAFLWLPEPNYGYPAGMIDLGTFGGLYSYADAVNEHGQVAGSASLPSGYTHAFLWLPEPTYDLPAGMHDLGPFGGYTSWAHAINDLGQVVGMASYSAGYQHAFVWLPEPAYGLPAGMTDLGTLGGPHSEAYAMNTSGQVVGWAYTATDEPHAFLWLPEAAYGLPAGLNDLGTLGGTWSTAHTINDGGQIIGDSSTASGWTHGFVWENGVMTDMGTLGGNSSHAYALNDLGQVVGYTETAVWEQHAFLWLPAPAYGLPAGMTDLNDRLPPGSGWELSSANLISDAGRIVGDGMNAAVPGFFFMTLGQGNSPDCNTNGVPDECEVDCNTNAIPDDCDIHAGTSADCQPNGIPDECETDCNANGIADVCDLAVGTSDDCQPDGAPDECQLYSGDCNNNQVPDECDIAGPTSTDCNADATPDECQLSGNDCNNNTTPDDCERDCNTNGRPDDCDISAATSVDCNSNAVPDECDLAGGTSPDVNANLVPDECEDCNSNDVPDSLDIAVGTSADCNTNAFPDECDLATGTSADVNSNSVPDECERCVAPVGDGDLDGNGLVNLGDYTSWPGCMTGPDGVALPACRALDMNGDCDVDLTDFAAFQRVFTGPGQPPGGLIAYWDFDEGTGTVLHDESGHGNNANIYGADWVPGRYGTGLEFAGTDYAGGIPASFDDSASTGFSVGAWIYWHGSGQNSYIFDARGSGGGGYLYSGGILYLGADGHLVFLLFRGSGDYEQVIVSLSSVPVGQWTHVVGVIDNSAAALRLYNNGQEDHAEAAEASYVHTNLTAAIGNNRWSPRSAPLNGVIDELRVYNHPLNTNEVQYLYFTPP